MNKGMIYERFGVGTVTLQDRIRDLSMSGLVIETREVKRWTSRRVELTEDGEAVAKHLDLMEPILEHAALAHGHSD